MRRLALIFSSLLSLVFVFAAIVGSALPKTVVTERTASFQSPVKDVWAIVGDIDAYNKWRKDVLNVDRSPASWERPLWKETTRFGNRRWIIVEKKENELLLVRTIESDLSDRVLRTFTFESRPDGGTNLKLSEKAEILNPVFRLFAHAGFSRGGAIDTFLGSLSRKLK